MTAPREISRGEIVAQLRSLGVAAGGVLLVHSSFRAVRPVEDGPRGLILALLDALGPRGTLVMPSWTGDDDVVFDSRSTAASPDLGIVAETFRQLPGVVRSTHPFAFAAAGPLASEITGDPLPLPPHRRESPVGRVFDHDGQVLLLGTGHNANTTLHLAELMAEVPYRLHKHCTVTVHGRPVRVEYGENDHCCERFGFAEAWLRSRGLQAEGTIGAAHARLARSRDIVSVALDNLAQDRLIFLHAPEAGCAECDAARGSIPA
jgi:aminoglycoside N3'-acetyltransferase